VIDLQPSALKYVCSPQIPSTQNRTSSERKYKQIQVHDIQLLYGNNKTGKKIETTSNLISSKKRV